MLERLSASALSRGIVGTVTLNVSTTLLNVVTTYLLAHLLGAKGYGAYAFAFAWATFLSVPASLGITPLVLRHVAGYAVEGKWGLMRGVIRRSNQVVLATGLAIAAGGGVVGGVLSGSHADLAVPFLIGLALVPLVSLTSLRQAVMKGLNHVVLGRLPETVVLPGLLAVALGGAALFFRHEVTPASAIGVTVAAALLSFLLGAALLRAKLPREVRSATPEYEVGPWVRSGVPLVLMSLLLVLNTQLGTIVLGVLGHAKSAGVFNLATRIAAFTSFLYLAASYPLYPVVARLWTAGDRPAMQRVVRRTAQLTFAASCTIGIVSLVFAGPLLRLFGGDFGVGTTTLRVLVLAELVRSAMGFGGLALVMTPYESTMAKGVAVGVAANVAAMAALVPFWGATGAAVGSMTGTVVSSVVIAWYAWRRLGLYAPAFGGSGLRR